MGWAGGEFSAGQAVDGLSVRYALESAGNRRWLDDLQSADWDQEGRLLLATRSGKLQVRHLLDAADHEIVFEEDLSALEPNPTPTPDCARPW